MRFLNKLHRKRWLAALGALLMLIVAAGCAESSTAPSPMEVTHASYLDLSANIADLRSRVAEWQKGDEGSLKIAQEKLDRIEVVLGAVSWPKSMAAAVSKTKGAVAPMAKALKSADQAAADTASKEFGDASHDVTHAFYGDWLPELAGGQSSQMAAHVIYLDIAANISDLQARVSQWQKGDESSMNVAKEKAERAEALIPHMASTGVAAKRLPAIQRGLLDVFAAIDKKDAAAAQLGVKPIAEASRELSRDIYLWMDIVASANDPSCVQASYLDLSRNISELRSGVAAWQKGDSNSLVLATERLERVQLLIGHTAWPVDMSPAMDKTDAAAASMARALRAKNPAAAEAASAEFGDASHDLTHSYYGDWLPSGQLKGNGVQVAGAQGHGQPVASSAGHAHGDAPSAAVSESGPNWLVIGSFGAILLLVVGIAGVTKPKAGSKGSAAVRQVGI